MSYIHIHAPQPSWQKIRREACPTCKRNTFFYVTYTEYYGIDCTCLKCGDSWEDGEMTERPFARAWRKRAIESAKRRWRAHQEATKNPA